MKKIALVTGGSRGLGRNASLKLAQEGVDVVLTYQHNKDDAQMVVTEREKLGRKAHALQLDVGLVKSFDQFAKDVQAALKEKFKSEKFDYLLNNAGQGVYGPIMNTTEEQFDSLMNMHFKGVFFLTQKLLPLMNDGGRILNVSSGLTRFSYPGYAAYASMKGAIEVFTRYLATELGPRRISVNSIAPGAIETDFGGGSVRNNKDLNKMISDRTPLGRVGQADDIGDVMAALLSEKTTWINGQRVEASGGIHM